jgi:hypothetical protein
VGEKVLGAETETETEGRDRRREREIGRMNVKKMRK